MTHPCISWSSSGKTLGLSSLQPIHIYHKEERWQRKNGYIRTHKRIYSILVTGPLLMAFTMSKYFILSCRYYQASSLRVQLHVLKGCNNLKDLNGPLEINVPSIILCIFGIVHLACGMNSDHNIHPPPRQGLTESLRRIILQYPETFLSISRKCESITPKAISRYLINQRIIH